MCGNALGKDPDRRGFPKVLLSRSTFQLRNGGGPWPGADAGRAERAVHSAAAALCLHRPDSRPAHLALLRLRTERRRPRSLGHRKRQLGLFMRLPGVCRINPSGGTLRSPRTPLAALALWLAAAALRAADPAAPLNLTLQEATRRALEHNTTLAVERENLEQAGLGILGARGAYDTLWSADLGWRRHTDPINSAFSGAPAGK